MDPIHPNIQPPFTSIHPIIISFMPNLFCNKVGSLFHPIIANGLALPGFPESVDMANYFEYGYIIGILKFRKI